MKHAELLDAYNEIIAHDKAGLNDDALAIIGRGVVACNNDRLLNGVAPLLILTGINPSYIDGTPAGTFMFSTAKDGKHSSFWKKKHRQFGGKKSLLVQEEMAYFDLFPLRESNQMHFEKVFRPFNTFRFQLLEKTSDAIEGMRPKLIVHANRSSLYYWGLNPTTYSQDRLNPWLGYSFDAVEDSCQVIKRYHLRIADVPEAKRFVHLFRISGRGFGDNVYFLTYIMEYYGMKDFQKEQLLYPEEMNDLWEWCKAN